jgi:hypothetical protein
MHQLKTLLGRIATGERWQIETRQANHIQTALKESLPLELTHACEAWLDEAETLTIACPNGMYASKLRQLTPRLVQQLRAKGIEVRTIRLEVQAGRVSPSAFKTKQVMTSPPEQIVAQIEQLGSKVSAEPLSRALKKLANTLRQPSIR